MVSSQGKGVVICCKTQFYSYMTSLELDDIILLEKVKLRQNLPSKGRRGRNSLKVIFEFSTTYFVLILREDCSI